MKVSIFIIFFFCTSLFSQVERKKITLTPGEKIQIGNITIVLDKTNYTDLLKKLNLKDKFPIYSRINDGFDIETLKDTSWYDYVRNIIYKKEVTFEYSGESPDSIQLKWITVKNSDSYTVKINENIMLGDINPPIDKYFQKLNKYDYISKDSLTYNLYSQGISFQFEKFNSGRILIEASVHFKLEE
jgi:hypothetical protein